MSDAVPLSHLISFKQQFLQDSENYATAVFIHGKECSVAPALNYDDDSWIVDGSGLSLKTQQFDLKSNKVSLLSIVVFG